MTVEVSGTVAKVSVGYSLKKPASGAYSSEDAHCSYGLEFDVAGKMVAQITEELEALEVQLHTNAKLAVFAQLGVEFDTASSGMLTPIIVDKPQKAKPAYTAKPAYAAKPAGGGNYPPRAPAKAAGRALPVVTLHGKQFYDQRVLKADGTYQDGAADFKSVDGVAGRHEQLWIYNRDGSVNEGVVSMMTEAGVE